MKIHLCIWFCSQYAELKGHLIIFIKRDYPGAFVEANNTLIWSKSFLALYFVIWMYCARSRHNYWLWFVTVLEKRDKDVFWSLARWSGCRLRECGPGHARIAPWKEKVLFHICWCYGSIIEWLEGSGESNGGAVMMRRRGEGSAGCTQHWA